MKFQFAAYSHWLDVRRCKELIKFCLTMVVGTTYFAEEGMDFWTDGRSTSQIFADLDLKSLKEGCDYGSSTDNVKLYKCLQKYQKPIIQLLENSEGKPQIHVPKWDLTDEGTVDSLSAWSMTLIIIADRGRIKRCADI